MHVEIAMAYGNSHLFIKNEPISDDIKVKQFGFECERSISHASCQSWYIPNVTQSRFSLNITIC